MKNSIPDRWNKQYESVLSLRTSPLKRAIEEIAELEAERSKLREDSDLLDVTLKDLQDCRRSTYKLMTRTNSLEEMLRKCQNAVAKYDK